MKVLAFFLVGAMAESSPATLTQQAPSLLQVISQPGSVDGSVTGSGSRQTLPYGHMDLFSP